MKKLLTLLCVSAVSCAAFGGAFTPGNLVVTTVGTGSGSLSSASTAAALWEYTTAGGIPVQMISLPISASGLNAALTLAGSATSEGFLTRSVDGRYLTLGGYNAAPGVASIATTAPSVYARVIGRIDYGGNIDTTTALSDAYSGSNIRSAVTTDGYDIWTGGNAGSGQGATAGTRYTTLGSTTSAGLHSTASNMRVVNIFGGQLYVSSSTSSGGGLLGVSTVGTGLPTFAAQVPAGQPVALPGMPLSGTHSAYDFWFKDADTLYIADDGAVSAGGGIQKWTLSGGTWSLAYTLLNDGATTTGTRGLTGTIDGDGNAVLFATASTTGTPLIEVVDTGASATAITLATAASGFAFRGVDWAPVVPEPATSALIGLGLAAFLICRRK